MENILFREWCSRLEGIDNYTYLWYAHVEVDLRCNLSVLAEIRLCVINGSTKYCILFCQKSPNNSFRSHWSVWIDKFHQIRPFDFAFSSFHALPEQFRHSHRYSLISHSERVIWLASSSTFHSTCVVVMPRVSFSYARESF